MFDFDEAVRRQKKAISVDDVDVFAPEECTPEEILRLAGKKHDLVLYQPGANGSVSVVPRNARIKTYDNQRFQSALQGVAGS